MLEIIRVKPNFENKATNQFQERLKKQRLLQNLTQKDLAKRSDTTKRIISDFEHGYEIPDIPILKRLSVSLNVSMDYLWGDTDIKSFHQIVDIHLEDIVSGESPYRMAIDGIRVSQEELHQSLDFIRFKRYQREK